MAIKAVGIGEDGSFKGRALTWLQATFASKTHEHVGVHQQDVTGATAVTVTNGHLYELTGTGAATVTLSGTVGAQVAIRWAGVAGTVAGAVVTDGNTYVAVRWSAGWTVLQVGVPAVPDTTNPTAGTLSVTVATTTATLTVTGAMDDVALHATPYAYSKDNGTTWSAWQADATYEATGLTGATTYTFRHKVRDASGNEKVGTAVVKTTDVSRAWVVRSVLDFTAADGTLTTAVTQTSGDMKLSATDLWGGAATPWQVSGNKACTVSGSDGNQSWDLRAAVQNKGLRVTMDYDIATQSTAFRQVLGIATTADMPARDIVGVSLIFNDTNSTAYITADNMTYTDVATSASSTTGLPTTGTITVEWGVSTCTVSINGVVKGTATFAGTLRGEGITFGNQHQTVKVDNATFEAYQ
ncbi:MAG: hypothetical protein JSS52_11325 [Proteobacteria bacterium]|nr:hypothetical protein [Pseudomonadota bacterium]